LVASEQKLQLSIYFIFYLFYWQKFNQSFGITRDIQINLNPLGDCMDHRVGGYIFKKKKRAVAFSIYFYLKGTEKKIERGRNSGMGKMLLSRSLCDATGLYIVVLLG
jgi:hypothetical protein